MNSAIHLYCSREQFFFFFFSVLILLTVFFIKKKKTSLEWIKFTCTVMSILYLIIFYLILLHAQKIMKTVVLIGWILFVMEL